VRRLIAFSTTARFYKTDSADDAERGRLAQLVAAEDAMAELSRRYHIVWTLFRPTLVYGCGRDRNVTAIARFVRSLGFFPIVDGGRGLRQPVHADDVAQACVAALDRPLTHGKAYTLSGGSVVTYRQMVEAVFRQLGRAPRIVEVPLPVLRAAIAAARWVPGLRSLSPEMASRMCVDLCFAHAEAAHDFGFRPRAFQLDDTAVGRA
jgi:nucleoside-diphosphate-sugar epimerase